MNSYQCLADYTTEALGVKTKLFAPADYNGVIQGLLGGNIDMAWLGASAYAATYLQDPEAVDPVLIKVNVDGSVGYHSIGFARKDSGVTSLDDMEGKVFGFGDPNSTSGYLIPSIEIPQYKDGVTMERGEYFGEVKFTGGHEQTIVAVNNGDIDGGVTWADGQGNWEDSYNSGALRKAVDAGLVDMNDMVQIWKSKVIPEGPVVLRKALPADVREKMTALVDGLFEADPDCAYGVASCETLGFQSVTHDTYISIVEARKAKIGDYPADVLSEAWEKRAELPALIVKYFPALIETINIAAVSTLIGAIGGLFLSLLGTRELAKMFSEVSETTDLKAVEGLSSTGATWLQRMLLGVLPQVAPNYVSYTLLRFEINIRASAILGFVGAGGLGYELRNAMAWGPDRFDEAAAIFILLFGTIVFFDQVSSRYRNKLTDGQTP